MRRNAMGKYIKFTSIKHWRPWFWLHALGAIFDNVIGLLSFGFVWPNLEWNLLVWDRKRELRKDKKRGPRYE